jgi:hypothetical protein
MKEYYKVLALLVRAQDASDMAKAAYSHSVCADYYAAKKRYIGSAVTILRKNNIPQIRYFIVEAPDQNGYCSTVTYFEFFLNHKKKQISFHCPIEKDTYKYLSGSGYATQWDRGNSKKVANEIFGYLKSKKRVLSY